MNNFYAVCDLGEDTGRVMLGTLHNDHLRMSEIQRFENVPLKEKDSLQWNITHLYQEILGSLRVIAGHEEPIDSISCNSWAADPMLFDEDGSLITPAYHHRDPRTENGMKEVFSRIDWPSIYDETGVQRMPGNSIYQLGAERSRRLNRASHMLPIADAFNFLLAGVPRIERSMASLTQLFNPHTKNWSDRVLEAMHLSPKLLPPVVQAGTKLGMLRKQILEQTGLEEAQVVAACSHELAAALMGLPVEPNGDWAFIQIGDRAVVGTKLVGPIINDISREWSFTNEVGYGGSVCFYKQGPGLWLLDECRKFWKEKDKEIDADVMLHLAISSPPFESLVNLGDPRFSQPGDMPLKIQAFCRETNQPVPRKPGPIARCVLESLALHYRRTVHEMEYLTGRSFERLYALGVQPNSLLAHFTANALQIPIVVAPSDAAAIGNVVVQALALGHIKSVEQARNIVRNSFKMETITPHANAWDAAYERLAEMVAA